MAADGDTAAAEETPRQKKSFRKDKPWDNSDIKHWETVKISREDNPTGMIEESSFAVLFPKYREKYLREVWPSVTAALKEHGIKCELNLVEGSMTVATTRKAYDPYIIIKARDLIKLLSRSVPAPQALKILEDEIECDIIKIGGMVGNKERFVKRRQRLLGPNGSTLKAIEILSQCYVLVQGNTVSVMGPYKGLKTVRRIVEDCMHNVHPVYHVKALMIKRELAKDPEMANENWERFLPKFKNKNVRSKKPKQPREKKAYTPFPPPQQPSKIDLAMESGEYFLSKEEKTRKSNEEKQAKQQNAVAAKKRQREEAFVSPVEEAYAGEPKAKRRIDSEDVKAMAASLKERVGKKSSKSPKVHEADTFIESRSVDKTKKKKKKQKKNEIET
mmetsp:Transcript_3057/g.11010  ORF Transcript_3057/g.11010 Transcript_3057/m.11010 type:complete len:388 (-) Transcript_3057:72-1235(-)